MPINLAQIAELGKDYVQLATPITLALLAYRQYAIEKTITEIKEDLKEIRHMFIGHLER